ncbi:MAG: hypothetical protein JNL58_26930 [Planctomyces sp.]|nr:hypothetical protein [Planctomyces sp.]
MYSAHTRQALVSYFNHSGFFKDVVNHSSGHHSIVRAMKGAKLERVHGEQHKMEEIDHGDGIPEWYEWDDVMWNGTWKFSGDVCGVRIPFDWFRDYEHRYGVGCRTLYPEQWTFEGSLKRSVSQCRFIPASLEQCMNLAMKSIASKQRVARWSAQRAGIPGSEQMQQINVNDLALLYFKSWTHLLSDPLRYLKRIDGRCFFPLVGQPRGLRRTNLRLFHNGKWELCAEVDMSSTYYVFLASWLDPSDSRDELICDLIAGRFYERLNEESGSEFSETDRDLLKIATQIECVFGKRGGRSGFGTGKLFLAMSRLYPDLARSVLYKRRNHDVSWLSRKLTNAEGSLFIDFLLPNIVNASVPCLPIHDGLVVPVSAAEMVRTLCCRLAKERLGFEPMFRIKYGAVA